MYKVGESTRPYHVPVLTPDGGVIMCSSIADAERVCSLLNEAARRVRELKGDVRYWQKGTQ